MQLGREGPRVYSRARALPQKGGVEDLILAERLVQHDGHGVAEIQAPDRAQGGNGPDVLTVLEQLCGKPHGLPAEDERVAGLELCVEIGSRRRGRKQVNPGLWLRFLEGFERVVTVNVDQIPVVEPCTSDGVIVDSKPQRPVSILLL